MKNSIQVIKKRRKQIIDLLNHTREISISELSKKMKVSEMTIRRDCDYLSKMGKISKKRGVISLVAPEEIPLSQPVSYIKQSLGKEAARYIHDGDIVFINSSSIAFDAIPHLLTKDIIIVTNNGYAGNFENTKSKVILTGGEIHHKLIMSGDLTTKAFLSLRANYAIIGCAGISINQGISTPVMEEAEVNKTIIQQSQKVIVVADYSKFNKFSNFTIGTIKDIDLLITDTFVENSVINEFIKAGVNVIQVPLK